MTLPPALPRGDFVTTYEGAQYECEPRYNEDYNCYVGPGLPGFGARLALYCSGSPTHLTCSTQWYPNVLSVYTAASIDGREDLCRPAGSGSWAQGDAQCVPYAGGDPTLAWLGSPLKCSQQGGALTCEQEYYPSEISALHLTFAKIGGQQYVCEPQSSLEDCYRWDGYSDPQYSTHLGVALYCTAEGVCTADKPSSF